MKNRLSKTIGTAALSLLMVIGFTQILVSANKSKAESFDGKGARVLEGSWIAQVTFRDCQTGEAIRTFASMNTFMQGGTMQEFGLGSVPAPRGPGHGVWAHITGRTFSSAFQFFRFNPDGSYAGKVIARRQIEVDDSGNHYTATSSVEIFNAAGTLITTSCTTEEATRFE